jgi:DNA-binding transcriptional ArsR family regulator
MEFAPFEPEAKGRADPRCAARFFQALGDPTRLRILCLLRDGERTVGDLVEALGVPQPKVSRHLKVLREVGLVCAERDGRNVRCGLTTPKAWPAEGRDWIDRLAEGMLLVEPSSAPTSGSPPDAEEGREPARSTRSDLETHLL